MARRRMSMRNVREILRLRYQLGLPGRQIASSMGYGHKTVQDYLARAEVAGLSWPLPEDLDDEALEKRLFPHNERHNGRPQPDFAWMHRELSEHEHLTLLRSLEGVQQGTPRRVSVQQLLRPLP